MGVFKSHYNHGIIPKYTLAFGTLFSSIQLVKLDSNGDEKERITVPIAQSAKEKFIQRNQQDPELLRVENITLPRMGYELVSFYYDSSRNITTKQLLGVVNNTNSNVKNAFFSPAPYILQYNLYIKTKTLTELYQIIEQILPAFKPDLTISVKLFPDIDIILDMPVSISTPSIQDNYDGAFSEEQREIMCVIPFTVKAWLFGPIKDKEIIKKIIFHYHPITEINVEPDANKVEYAKVEMTVVSETKPTNQIFETDEWSIDVIYTSTV